MAAGALHKEGAQGKPDGDSRFARRGDLRATQVKRGLMLVALAFSLMPGQVRGSTDARAPDLSSTNEVSTAESGAERLKKDVKVTVETESIAGAIADGMTNAPSEKEKSFHWKFSWKNWDGIHYDLSQKTKIGDPLAAFRLKDHHTNTFVQPEHKMDEVRGTDRDTNTYRIFHLEELKMSGKIGIKLQVDGATYATGKEFQNFDDGVELRRARIYAKGDCILLLPVSYELELGYIPNQFYIENSYLAFRNIPLIGELKFGQYQTPMGLESVTSSRDVTFMEEASPLEALAPGVNAGIQIGKPIFGERATWRMGVFTSGAGQDTGDATKNYGRAIIRLTGLPIYEINPGHPDMLLHLGVSANVSYSGSSSVQYRSRPESHLAPYVLDTGRMDADKAGVVGAEAAWVSGPLSLQGEYLHSWVVEQNGRTPSFDGFYASASWFLTGESRPYNRVEGAFGRVIPKRNFDFRHGGWGAWEIAGRISYTDLDAEDIHGGRMAMFMGGVNWYLHSHVKWRFDYGFGHVAGRQPEGNLNLFQTRMEIDF
jgi:phosphate-selective porin OprO/OprP